MDGALVNLCIAALAFNGGHLAIASTPARRWLIARLGRRPYLLAYSALAALCLGWLLLAYEDAPYVMLWGEPEWARWLALALMPLSLALVVGAYRRDNPTAVMYRQGSFDAAQGGVFAITRHPLMWGIALWALLHLLANGDASSLILFGGFGLLALIGTLAIDRRKRRDDPALWRQLAAATSNLPLLALAQGRARLRPTALIAPVIGGLVLWGLLLAFHNALFGVSPLP